MLVICLSFSLTAFTQDHKSRKQSNVQIMDLVVEVPRLELNKSFDQLKNRLNRVQSLRVEGYCNSMKMLCLRFHPEQYFNVLVALNEAGYAYYIKKDENVNSAINACTDKSGLYIRENSSVLDND